MKFLFILFPMIILSQTLSLNECINMVYENNLQIKNAKINTKLSELGVKTSKNERLPTVSGNFSHSYQLSYQLLESENHDYLDNYNNQFGLNADILIWNNRNLTLNIKKSELNLLAQQYETEALKFDLKLQVINDYLTILLNKELMSVASQSVDIKQKQYDRTEKLYKAGSIPLSYLYEVQANLSTEKQNYETAKISLERSKFNLIMLISPDQTNDISKNKDQFLWKTFDIEDIDIPEDLEQPAFPEIDSLPNESNGMKKVMQYQTLVEVSKVQEKIAKTKYFPTISGSYRYGMSYADYFFQANPLFNQWWENHNHTFSLQVSIPIFNKGQTANSVQQAKIGTEIQQNILDQEKLKYNQTIQSLWFDLNASYEKFVAAKESYKSSKMAFDFAEKSYEAGKINNYDFNITANNLTIANSRLIQSKYEYVFKTMILKEQLDSETSSE